MGMRMVLAAALLLAACGDNREPTLGDYAGEFAAAAEAWSVACRKSGADQVAERIVARVCDTGDCRAAMACEPRIDQCLAEIDAMPCDSNTWPDACFDLTDGCL
jgi:hypothetical protein